MPKLHKIHNKDNHHRNQLDFEHATGLHAQHMMGSDAKCPSCTGQNERPSCSWCNNDATHGTNGPGDGIYPSCGSCCGGCGERGCDAPEVADQQDESNHPEGQ